MPARPEATAAPARAAPPVAGPPAPPATAGAKSGRSVDVLSELEKLRRQALEPLPGGAPAAARNGRGEMSRSVELNLPRADFARARRVLVTLEIEDEQNRVVEAVRDLQVDIKDAAKLQKLLLRLNIALNASD
jgi:hypothetical protein